MHVEPIKPTLKAPGAKRLKLKHDGLLSSFAFNFSSRRYSKARASASAAEAAADGEARGTLEGQLSEAAAREEALGEQLEGLRAVGACQILLSFATSYDVIQPETTRDFSMR